MSSKITGTITANGGSVEQTLPDNPAAIVAVFGAVHSGLNVKFEVSPDDGTTYFPVLGFRLDTGALELSSGVLPNNSKRIWAVPTYGQNKLKATATAYVSGTLNVII